MAKVMYNIRVKDKSSKKAVIKQCNGYTLAVDGICFGVTNHSQLPEEEKLMSWYITELHTGYLCGNADTKAKAIDRIFELYPAVSKALVKAKEAGVTNANANTPIIDWYEL